jgi:hypothetical protein
VGTQTAPAPTPVGRGPACPHRTTRPGPTRPRRPLDAPSGRRHHPTPQAGSRQLTQPPPHRSEVSGPWNRRPTRGDTRAPRHARHKESDRNVHADSETIRTRMPCKIRARRGRERLLDTPAFATRRCEGSEPQCGLFDGTDSVLVSGDLEPTLPQTPLRVGDGRCAPSGSVKSLLLEHVGHVDTSPRLHAGRAL